MDSHSHIFHTVPDNDLVCHDWSGDDCVCLPQGVFVKAKDGCDGWVLIHHSLDGREKEESV